MRFPAQRKAEKQGERSRERLGGEEREREETSQLQFRCKTLDCFPGTKCSHTTSELKGGDERPGLGNSEHHGLFLLSPPSIVSEGNA